MLIGDTRKCIHKPAAFKQGIDVPTKAQNCTDQDQWTSHLLIYNERTDLISRDVNFKISATFRGR